MLLLQTRAQKQNQTSRFCRNHLYMSFCSMFPRPSNLPPHSHPQVSVFHPCRNLSFLLDGFEMCSSRRLKLHSSTRFKSVQRYKAHPSLLRMAQFLRAWNTSILLQRVSGPFHVGVFDSFWQSRERQQSYACNQAVPGHVKVTKHGFVRQNTRRWLPQESEHCDRSIKQPRSYGALTP